MKSLLRTVSLVVSAMLILIVPYIPHHHHHGEVCMERVLCAHDLEYNDSHTGHDAEDSHDTGTCVKHVVALQVQKKHGGKVSQRLDMHVFHAFAGVDRLMLAQRSERRHYADGAVGSLLSCIIGSPQLRAPPASL